MKIDKTDSQKINNTTKNDVCNNILVEDNVIINSMKKVFDEELASLNNKIALIANKHNIKDSNDLMEKYNINKKDIDPLIRNIFEIEENIENNIEKLDNIDENYKDVLKLIKYESDVRKVNQYMKELNKHTKN
ncbi:hypothetical protein [Methanococcus voltae]|uniref:Uncharacterized protein n=1 Tax=Methanococcus voltae (strain ATCC BAA-1334 / A3) TaxID=456320 RepID=D7DR38_METV3|nr:hypothetical protein [Methanococcus voltae]MCS3900975.1 hypothetical protein [Methanococcus voltae]